MHKQKYKQKVLPKTAPTVGIYQKYNQLELNL